MTDIVEQLRDLADGGSDSPWWWEIADRRGPAPALRDAADEIERLRRAVNRMADAAGPAWTPRWVLDAPWRRDQDAPLAAP